MLVYASSYVFWSPPFPVVPLRLSYNYGTRFYVVACQLHAVPLYNRMAHWSPNDIVGCAPWCGKGIHKILCGSTCQQADPHYARPHLQGVGTKTMAALATNFSKEAYYVWLRMRRMALPQAVVPSRESTIAVMRANSRKLVHDGLTKPSRLSIADQGALQFRKLWRSIVRCDIVVWVDNWWHAQFRANPVKPNVCLDVTAIAVLHTTPLPHFLGHPSLRDLVDRVDTVAMAAVQWHREMLKVCTDMCNTPISRRTIRAPLDVALEAGRQQLFWKPFGIYECRRGQNQELLDLLDMLRTTQRHCQKPMALLIDCNIHYRVLKFSYSRATIDWNFLDWLRGISLIYGVPHPYKHVCNIIWRKFFPLFWYITAPMFGAGARMYNHPKLIVIEKTIAALLLSAPDIRAQLRQKITLFEGRANQAALLRDRQAG